MTTLELAIEIIGWVAAVLILAAYGLLSAGRLTANDRSYQWMNVAGAVGFVVNSGWNGAIPSAALNVVWAGIGGAALWRIATAPTSRSANI